MQKITQGALALMGTSEHSVVIINEYNGEQDRVIIEKSFMKLVDLTNSMIQEECYAWERFKSNEELFAICCLHVIIKREHPAIKRLLQVKTAYDKFMEEMSECYGGYSISAQRVHIYEHVY